MIAQAPMDPRTGRQVPPDYVVEQNPGGYSPQDHQVWGRLYRRQADLLRGRVVDDFYAGLTALHIDEDHIPIFDGLNRKLRNMTGWEIVAVPGLVPDRVFFEHLANRRFPAGYWVRKPEELDYIEEPDVFHDVFGHVPLLTQSRYADYMQAYGMAGLGLRDERDLARLARLYWYTIEFGLMNTHEGLRIFGAGIASSGGETVYSLESETPVRVRFNPLRVLRTRYKINDFQVIYFVLDGFGGLPRLDPGELARELDEIRSLPDFDPGEVAPGDRVFRLAPHGGLTPPHGCAS